jgi:hypothetical protein
LRPAGIGGREFDDWGVRLGAQKTGVGRRYRRAAGGT